MVDPNHSLWLSASHLPALRLHMILTKTSTKTDKSSFSQKRLISLSPHLIFRTTPFYFVTYSPFCNLIGLQYALQREQLDVDQTLSARARGCGYARLIGASVSEAPSCGLDGRAVMHDIYIYIYGWHPLLRMRGATRKRSRPDRESIQSS